jgi:hypothetical protein
MRKDSGHQKVILPGLLFFLLYLSPGNLFSQNMVPDFNSMKGTLLTYTISDNIDTLSSKVITELRDEKGIPLWFSRDLFLAVCLTGVCQMVQVSVYWTGAGTYFGFQTSENQPMTKTDHSKFKKEDYEKLHLILSDSLSVLKRYKIEELTVETESVSKDKKLIDGHSGATEPSLAGYVVKDAVYTSFTVWHSVYGYTMEKIKSIIEQRTDESYLKMVFEEKKPLYVWWAIDFIKKHPRYHQAFYREIMGYINSDNINLSKSALGYFTPAILSDEEIQKELAIVMNEASLQRKFEIIWKFSTLQRVNDDIIIDLLGQYESQKLSTTMLGNVCEMITAENLQDTRIQSKLQNISKDENQYVKNITARALSKTKN